MRRVPGVLGVSEVRSLPTMTSAVSQVFARAPETASTLQIDAETHLVDSAFFSATRLPVRMLSGDGVVQWRSGDDGVVLSESAGRALGGREGRYPSCVSVGGAETKCRNIIGIASDANFIGGDRSSAFAIYELISNEGDETAGLLVRSYESPAVVQAVIQAEVGLSAADHSPMVVRSVRAELTGVNAPWRDGLHL